MDNNQLMSQREILIILAEQGITSYYFSFDGKNHTFYIHDSHEPLFSCSTAGMRAAWVEWCNDHNDNNPNDMIIAFGVK